MSDTIRIGSVAFLNARPLVHGLEHGCGPDPIALSYAAPSELADRMLGGELDLALLPVIELARMPDLEIVPGLGIVTSGASRSVLLVSKVAIERVESIALDAESRTSNALARVLCASVWRCRPKFTSSSGSLAAALEQNDAAVRIGDKALFEPTPRNVFVYDLGTVWTDNTRLPFVFAAWAARRGTVGEELYRTLHESCRLGSLNLERIAREYTWRGRSDPTVALDYLTHNIRFRLGPDEIQALELFFRTAAETGVVDRAPELRLATPRRAARRTAASESELS